MDFGPYMSAVAVELLGQPRPGATKTEVRFGAGLTVNPQKGTWYDHQNERGGGVLDLIERMTGRKGREAIDWLREHGFPVEDRPPEPDRPRSRKDQKGSEPAWKPVKTWDYTDETGALLYQVVRLENGLLDDAGKPRKSYRQRRPDPEQKDGWNWSVKGTRLVPYRLAEVQEAVALGLTVFIAEGEKAVDRLVEMGVPATCNSGGAGKWPEGFDEIFRGANVVILPDNDEPGAKHRDLVAQRLAPVASSVRVLELPNLPPKGDVVDWSDAGGTVDALYDLVESAARPWGAAEWRSAFGAIPWSRLDDPAPEHEWLVKGWLTRGERSMVAGPSQGGKSFFVVDLAMAIARGVPFHGHRTLKGGVCYQAGEGGKGLKKRLRAYRTKYDLSLSDDIPFVLLPKAVDLYASDEQAGLLIREVQHWSSTFSVPLELVVIDTLSAATPGANENASEDMSRVLARLEKVAEACKCHVMLVHHMNAQGSKPRGHTSIFANLDNVILVQVEEGRHEHEPVTRIETGKEYKREIRRAKVVKQKDGEGGGHLDFVLEQILLGRDFHGDAITSCVIVEPKGASDEAEQPRNRKGSGPVGLGGHDWLLIRAMTDALAQMGQAPPPSLGLPRSIASVVDFKHVRNRYSALSPDPEEDPKKRAETIKKQIQRSGERLLKSGLIGREHPWIWFTGRLASVAPTPSDAPEGSAADDDPLEGWPA